MRRGTCPLSSLLGPAHAASAELSSGLQGLPRHAAPPGPAPHSPPRARNLFSRECRGVLKGLYFSRGLYFLILLLGRQEKD